MYLVKKWPNSQQLQQHGTERPHFLGVLEVELRPFLKKNENRIMLK